MAVTQALGEMAGVLIPGGTLLLAFHGAEGEAHAEDWFGRGVSIDATPRVARCMPGLCGATG